MKRTKTFTFFVCLLPVFLLWLGGCMEIIDVKLSSTEVRLVVDARFTDEVKSHIVKLSRTCDYFDPHTDSLGVRGAEVYVTDAQGLRIDFSPVDTMPGWYASAPDVSGRSGETYSLHIWADADGDGVREYYETGNETMPFMPTIDSVKAVYGYSMPPFYTGDRKGWNILLYAMDPPTKEYCGFSYAVNGKVYEDSISNIFLFPDNFSSGVYLRGVALYCLPDTTEVNKHLVKVFVYEGDTVSVLGYSFTEGYSNYISEVRSSLSSNIPVFSGAPSNIKGNISNNAFGYFAVYSVEKASCIVKKQTAPMPFKR